MATVEVSLAPAIVAEHGDISGSWNPKKVGDAYFRNSTATAPVYSATAQQFGRDDAAKNNLNYGMAAHYDTSAIPLNATVTKAKLEMTASASDSGVSTANLFDVLSLHNNLNSVDRTFFNAQFIYHPEEVSTSSSPWADARKTGASVAPLKAIYQDLRHSVGSVAQAWTATSAMTVDEHWWMLRKVSLVEDGFSFSTNLYEAAGGGYVATTSTATLTGPATYVMITAGDIVLKGFAAGQTINITLSDASIFTTTIDYVISDYDVLGDLITLDNPYSGTVNSGAVISIQTSVGSYFKGDLLDTGTLRDASAIPTATNTIVYTEPSTPFLTEIGKTYISELVFNGLAASDTDTGRIDVRWKHDADGSTDNALMIAASGRKLQGWTEASVESAYEISAATKRGTADSVTVPSFVSGTRYEFGAAAYSPDVELTNFTSNLGLALGDRSSTDEWIGIRVQNFTSSIASSWRRTRSSRHASATRDALYGMILTLEYTVPDPLPREVLAAKGSRTRPAVTARRSLAQTALVATTAARAAVTASRSTTQTALRSTSRTRSAITSRGGRIRE